MARPLRAAGLAGASHRRGGPVTTRGDERARPAPDPVERDFGATGPNRLRVADITYVPTPSGFSDPAVVPDARGRKLVGWAMANHPGRSGASPMRAELVLDAAEVAVGQRRPGDVIHHPDRGSRCPSPAFGERRKEDGVRPSVGSVGDACHDATCEGFFATLGCELFARRRFA